MDLLEFSEWLRTEMDRQGIPENAQINWIDIGLCSSDTLELTYDSETNQVHISSM